MKSEAPWWYYYRRQFYKKRNYLSMEMVVRKSFVETFKEYLSTSSIGGIKQILDPNNTKFERCFWIVIFCVALAFVSFFLHSTWVTTFTMPFIVSGESTTYPISEMDFPAVSVCNFNRISQKASMAYALEALRRKGLIQVNMTYFEVFTNLGRLIDYRYDEEIQKIIDGLPRGTHYDFIKMMSELAPKCDEMLIKCRWAGEDVSCMNIFQVRRTSLGHCCAFNYVLKQNSADSPSGVIGTVKRQKLPGSNNGLMVVLDPLVDDYAYRLGVRDGFQVLLHDAEQFPDAGGGRVLYRMAQPNYALFLQIESIKQYATSEVHKYSPRTRQCLFRDEVKNLFGNMYSLSACLVRCRIETIRSLCKCVPFYYPSGIYKDNNTCTLRNLWCLNKYKEKLLYLYPFDTKDTSGLEVEFADSLYCPDCLPDCEMTQHFIRNFRVSLPKTSRTRFESDFLIGVNITNKCFLNIFRPTSVGVLYRLDVVAYWFEILSEYFRNNIKPSTDPKLHDTGNIGGFAGMMMGIGCFTFVEMLYFIAIRLVRSIYINYQEHH